MNSRRITPGVLIFLAGGVAVCGLVGCGGGGLSTYSAGGKVTFPDGTPLAGGWVEFQPVNSEHAVSARGEIQADGTFELGTNEPGDGAIEGEHRALVTPPPFQGDRDEMTSVPETIDRKFQQFDTSGLKFTVTAGGDNHFEIQVTRPGQ